MLPFYETDRTVTPTPVNPLGVKGAGETGTIAVDAGRGQRGGGRAGAARASDHIERCRSRPSAVWKTIQAAKSASKLRAEDAMYPAEFEYHTPGDASRRRWTCSASYKDDAKLLAGGHSLHPDDEAPPGPAEAPGRPRARSRGLAGIKEEGGTLVIGAMTTHYAVESSRGASRRSARCSPRRPR